MPTLLNMFLAAAVIITVAPATVLGQQPPREHDVLVWPLPPDPPRIRYVGFYHSEADVGRKLSFGAKLKRTVLGRQTNMMSFLRPHDVYVDERGRIYCSDVAAHVVVALDPDNKAGRVLGAVEGPGLLVRPIGLGGDGAGHIYVTDPAMRRVVVFDTTGAYVRALGGEQVLYNPVDVAVDAVNDRVYVVDSQLHQIVVFDGQGTVLQRIGRDEGAIPAALDTTRNALGARDVLENRGSGEGEFRFPGFAAVAGDGTLYVTDQLNSRVQAFDADGNFLRAFGRPGRGPGLFLRPKGLAVDREGHIYVADTAFNNIQIFDAEGRILLAFGNMGFGDGELRMPTGMHIDDGDRIYVADKLNSRVQAYQYLPESETN